MRNSNMLHGNMFQMSHVTVLSVLGYTHCSSNYLMIAAHSCGSSGTGGGLIPCQLEEGLLSLGVVDCWLCTCHGKHQPGYCPR